MPFSFLSGSVMKEKLLFLSEKCLSTSEVIELVLGTTATTDATVLLTTA